MSNRQPVVSSLHLSPEYLEGLNDLLDSPEVKANPMAGYYMGVISVIVHQRAGRLPSRTMLADALECTGLFEAVQAGERFAVLLAALGQSKPSSGASSGEPTTAARSPHPPETRRKRGGI